MLVKEPPSNDAPSDGEPILIPLVARICTPGVDLLLREDVVSRHLLVAEELEHVAAEVVRRALGDDVHDAANALCVLCGELRRVDVELANGRFRNVVALLAAL